MPWELTLEICDCAVPLFKIQGASISDGTSLGTGLTDENGQLMYVVDDSIRQYLVQISHPGSTIHAINGYIDKNFILYKESSDTIQTVCLNAKPTGCFTGDTEITLADWTSKPIALVRVGDLVLGRSGQPNRVTAIERPRLGDRRLYAFNEGAPFVTAEHPFLTKEGWKAVDPDATVVENLLMAGRLGVKDVVLGLQECAVAVGSSGSGDSFEVALEPISLYRLDSRRADPETELFNLFLDGDHSYFANGFIVHNKTPAWCFIVSATTGSSESAEVTRLRQLRQRVASASRLGSQLIELIYRDYYQFSPEIAGELKQGGIAQEAVLSVVVRPLLAWYTLAGVLALEQTGEKGVNEATEDMLNACRRNSVGSAIVTLLETIRAGEALPANTNPLLLGFAPRIQEAARLQFASWAILDPLVRVWRSATGHVDVIDEVAQWLATAPLEALAPPSNPQILDAELRVLAGFFDFRPTARRQLGERLAAAWPDAASALERAGLVSQTLTNE